MNRRLLSVALLAAALGLPVPADDIRTNVAAIVVLDASAPEGVSVALRYNDAIGIFLPDDPLFIQGIELELRIPKAVQGAEASISWTIYADADPDPSPETYDYVVDLVATQPLPSRVSMVLRLPVVERHGLRSDPYASVVPVVCGPRRFPLVFKLAPIGKGFGPAVENAEFKLVVRPVLADEGGARLSVSFPPDAAPVPLAVYLDDRRLDDPAATIVARKGLHVVRVQAEGYREEIVSVPFEAGRVTAVELTLVPDVPLVSFEVPAGTVVTMDGEAIVADGGTIAVEPGEHTVVCRIGDYTISRKFMAMRGKTYRVVLAVQMDILAAP